MRALYQIPAEKRYRSVTRCQVDQQIPVKTTSYEPTSESLTFGIDLAPSAAQQERNLWTERVHQPLWISHGKNLVQRYFWFRLQLTSLACFFMLEVI